VLTKLAMFGRVIGSSVMARGAHPHDHRPGSVAREDLLDAARWRTGGARLAQLVKCRLLPSHNARRPAKKGREPAECYLGVWLEGPALQFDAGGHRSGRGSRSHGYSHWLPVRQRLRRGVILGRKRPTCATGGSRAKEETLTTNHPNQLGGSRPTARTVNAELRRAHRLSEAGVALFLILRALTARHLRNGEGGMTAVRPRSRELADRASNGTQVRPLWRQGPRQL